MINKKKIAAIGAITAALAATASVNAGTYTSKEDGWVFDAGNGTIEIVEREDGGHMLHMRGDGSTDTIARARAHIQANGAEYMMSMKYKEGRNWWINCARVAESGSGKYDPYDLSKDKTNSWKKAQIEGTDWYDYYGSVWYEVKNTENYWFNLLVANVGEYWVDDVMVTKKNTDTVLFFDDFETEIENVTQTRNSILWEIPDDAEYESLKIYRTTDDGDTSLVKTLDYGVTSVTAEELGSFEGIYTLKPVKTVQITDTNGNKTDKKLEMDGEKIVVLKEVEYGMGLYNGSTEMTSLQTGTFTVKAFVKNNKVDAGIGAQFITMLKKDGKRVSATASEVKTAPADESKTEFTAEVIIPDMSDGEYELSMYLWDSLEGMKIITPSITITE